MGARFAHAALGALPPCRLPAAAAGAFCTQPADKYSVLARRVATAASNEAEVQCIISMPMAAAIEAYFHR